MTRGSPIADRLVIVTTVGVASFVRAAFAVRWLAAERREMLAARWMFGPDGQRHFVGDDGRCVGCGLLVEEPGA